jgi:hypothetical protein
MISRITRVIGLLTLAILFAGCSFVLPTNRIFAGDDNAALTPPEAKPPIVVTMPGADPNRWMIVLCSLGGDEEHEERLTEAVNRVVASAEPVFGVQPDHMRVLISGAEMAKKVAGAKACDRGSIAELATELAKSTDSQSQLFFFVLGHSHLEGRKCQFNISGPDIDQLDYASLFASLPGKEQIHWIGLPASGYWIKPLSGANRTILVATEPDMEITATEMPYALGAVLAGTAEHSALEDIDGDGKLTLMDLYLAVNIEVHQSFVTQDYLPTEHAQLDDNGDGRGTEVQEPFLPRKEGDPPARKSIRKISDGDLTRSCLLRKASMP